MRAARPVGLLVLLAAIAASPLHAHLGIALGEPRPGQEFGDCDGAQPLEPTAGNLFMIREGAPCDFLTILEAGRVLFGCEVWSGGFYDCPSANWGPGPITADETVCVAVPMYPDGEPAGLHRGWLFLDSTQGTTGDFGPNVTQALDPITVTPVLESGPAPRPGGPLPWTPRPNPAGDPESPWLFRRTGVVYRFRAVVEFGRDWPGTIQCRIGGDPHGRGFDDRPLLGYNIYRLMNVPPGVSTPDHYLLGPDLRPGTGDEGWVAFYPSGTGAGGAGLDLSDPAGPPSQNDNDPTDCFGIEGRDWDGDTVVGPEDDAILVYYDVPGLAPLAPDPDDLQTGSFTYVFQPVLKCPIHCSRSECRTWDATGDGVPDAMDLDGDGKPEFLDPGGHGCGLTADIEGRRTILISPELQASGGAPIVVLPPPVPPVIHHIP